MWFVDLHCTRVGELRICRYVPTTWETIFSLAYALDLSFVPTCFLVALATLFRHPAHCGMLSNTLLTVAPTAGPAVPSFVARHGYPTVWLVIASEFHIYRQKCQ